MPMSFDRNAKVLDRKWPWPEKGKGQRRRVGGGTKGTSSNSDPHGGVEEKNKIQKSREQLPNCGNKATGEI